MKYAKPPLTFEKQADLLLSRGMAGDRALMISRLAVVNYYRLSGYWHTFRKFPDQTFQEGTTFEKIWTRYAFDRRLRVLVMDAIERVEVAFRTQLVYHHAHLHGAFGYANDPTTLPDLRGDQRDRLLAALADELLNSKETFAEHFRTKYGGDHAHMPIWMASEIMTFGHMLTLFRGSTQAVKRAVAAPLGVHDTVVNSWLLTLNTVRNICAHHGRLWNRALGTKPMIPRNDLQWRIPIIVPNDRVFGVLTILKYCLDRIAPQSQWPQRVALLLNEYPTVPRASMGFPPEWLTSPIWKGVAG
jgi:abortive infection bacteriophage resistance protein